MSFTELQFPPEISQGSSFGPAWRTRISMVSSGFEDRAPKWTQQQCRGNALHENINQEEFETILDWFMAMRGAAYGFRFKDWGDYQSCGINTAPAFDDQIIGAGDGSTVAFQLVKKYTKGLTYTRNIKKPVAGTVLAGIDGVESTTNFSTDTATGIITFDNITKTITNAVSSGVNTVLTASAHGLVVGDSVYLSTFTAPWSGLNGARYSVTAVTTNTFTIVFNSSGYAAYSANGGQLKTAPQTGESVTAGFEFDVPVRFDTDEMDASYSNFQAFNFTLPIVELKL